MFDPWRNILVHPPPLAGGELRDHAHLNGDTRHRRLCRLLYVHPVLFRGRGGNLNSQP